MKREAFLNVYKARRSGRCLSWIKAVASFRPLIDCGPHRNGRDFLEIQELGNIYSCNWNGGIHHEVEKIMVASALVARIPTDIRVLGLFPGCFRGQAVIPGSGCALLGAA